jgi:hypothetical protein
MKKLKIWILYEHFSVDKSMLYSNNGDTFMTYINNL